MNGSGEREGGGKRETERKREGEPLSMTMEKKNRFCETPALSVPALFHGVLHRARRRFAKNTHAILSGILKICTSYLVYTSALKIALTLFFSSREIF